MGMEFLMVAEKFDLKNLKKKAMNHLAERLMSKKIKRVPRLAEALESDPHLKDNLITCMSDQNKELKEIQKQLVGEVIKVTVVMLDVKEWRVEKDETERSGQRQCMNDYQTAWTETIFLKRNNKIQSLFTRLEEIRPCPTGRRYILAEKYWCKKTNTDRLHDITLLHMAGRKVAQRWEKLTSLCLL